MSPNSTSNNNPAAGLKSFPTLLHFLSEEEANFRGNYGLLQKIPQLIRHIASECNVHAIELTSPQDLGICVIATGRHENAQAISGISCFIRHYQQGIPSIMIMLPVNEATKISHEIEKSRRELGLIVHIGAHTPPARLYPIFISAAAAAAPEGSSSDVASKAQNDVLKAARRLKDLTSRSAATFAAGPFPPSPAHIEAEGGLPNSPVASPWGQSGLNGDNNLYHPHQTNNSGRGLISGANVGGVNGIAGGRGTGISIPQVISNAAEMGTVGVHGVDTGLKMVPMLGTTMIFPSIPAILGQSITILYHYFDLKPVQLEKGGTDFFQAWSQAFFAKREESFRVRQSLALTYSIHTDLRQQAETKVLFGRFGGQITDYIGLVRNEHTYLGSDVDIMAAARFTNTLVRVFDAETQVTYTFNSRSSVPPSREVSFLHFGGYYWLLEKATEPTRMDGEEPGDDSLEDGMPFVLMDLPTVNLYMQKGLGGQGQRVTAGGEEEWGADL